MDISMPIRFDKLRFVKKLQEANQPPEMAEALADALDDALDQSQRQLLTRAEFDLRIMQLESKIDTQIANLETKLTESMYKMVGIMIAGVGLLMTLMKFFN